MTLWQTSLTCQIWVLLCDVYKDSNLHRLLAAAGRWCSEQIETSRILRPLCREGAAARAWESSLPCRALTALVNLPGTLLHAWYRAWNLTFEDSFFARLVFDLGDSAPVAQFWCIAALWCIPYERWNNAYSFMTGILLLLLFYVGSMRSGRRLDIARIGFYPAVMFLSVVLAVVFSYAPGLSARFLVYHVSAALLVVITVSAVRNAADLKRLCAGATVCVAGTGAYGIVQRIQGVKVNPSYVDLKVNAGMPGRVYSIFDNPNTFAQVLLLLLPLACGHRGDLAGFREKALACTPDETARSILISLDMTDLLGPDACGAEAVLLERLLSSDLPKSARIKLLNVQKNSRAVLERALPLLERTVDALTQLLPELMKLTELLTREVNAVGCEACLREISTFPAGKAVCHLRPLVVDPGTNLCLDAPAADGSYTIYCGVMRAPLWHLQISSQASLDQIYECIRLLGDRTRFDIFCYLQDHPAYGQELSKHFGLARNTIHHHMSQMFKAGLVNCTMEGTRVYYSIAKDRYSRLLDQQRALLLGGYPSQE